MVWSKAKAALTERERRGIDENEKTMRDSGALQKKKKPSLLPGLCESGGM